MTAFSTLCTRPRALKWSFTSRCWGSRSSKSKPRWADAMAGHFAEVTMRRVRVTYPMVRATLNSSRLWKGKRLSYISPKQPFLRRNRKLRSNDRRYSDCRTLCKIEIEKSMSCSKLRKICKRRNSWSRSCTKSWTRSNGSMWSRSSRLRAMLKRKKIKAWT